MNQFWRFVWKEVYKKREADKLQEVQERFTLLFDFHSIIVSKCLVYFRAETHRDTIGINQHVFWVEQNGGVLREMDHHHSAHHQHYDPGSCLSVCMSHYCSVVLLVHKPTRQETDLKAENHSDPSFGQMILFSRDICLKKWTLTLSGGKKGC